MLVLSPSKVDKLSPPLVLVVVHSTAFSVPEINALSRRETPSDRIRNTVTVIEGLAEAGRMLPLVEATPMV